MSNIISLYTYHSMPNGLEPERYVSDGVLNNTLFTRETIVKSGSLPTIIELAIQHLTEKYNEVLAGSKILTYSHNKGYIKQNQLTKLKFQQEYKIKSYKNKVKSLSELTPDIFLTIEDNDMNNNTYTFPEGLEDVLEPFIERYITPLYDIDHESVVTYLDYDDDLLKNIKSILHIDDIKGVQCAYLVKPDQVKAIESALYMNKNSLNTNNYYILKI